MGVRHDTCKNCRHAIYMSDFNVGWKHKPYYKHFDCIGPEPRIMPDCTCEDEEYIMLHSWCRKMGCRCKLHSIYINL